MTLDRKRQKVEEKSYTQGPLDEEFGQHSAFPIGNSSENDEVYEYLRSVRREAEADKSFHFVERTEKEEKEESAQLMMIVPQETIDKIMDTFKAQKQARDERLEQEENEDAEEKTFQVPESAALWRKKVFSEQPDPQFLDFLEHTTIIKLIVYYTKWLLASLPEELGKWIFLTLLRLDSDLDHRETAIVRDLGKKAVKIRAKLEELEGSHAVCEYITDMTLVIVAIHFRQRDLLTKSNL